MRIVFAGTPEFAVSTLRALQRSDHEIVGCFTQPDRPAGRGRKAQASPVKRAAEENNIPVYQPLSFRDADALALLTGLQADLMVVVAYGQLLPQSVLDTPRLGCLNVHASLLPRWRGAAPIHRAILAGDTESGVCVMQMAAGLDTGAVWSRWACALDDTTTTAVLHDVLAEAGATLLVDTLPLVAAGTSEPVPQDDALTCYAHKLEKAEAAIDWTKGTEAIARQVRAFNPWPVAQCGSPLGVVRVWDALPLTAQLSTAEVVHPGKVVDESSDGICIQTGEGILAVKRLQLAGKKPMTSVDFLNGRSLLGQTLT